MDELLTPVISFFDALLSFGVKVNAPGMLRGSIFSWVALFLMPFLTSILIYKIGTIKQKFFIFIAYFVLCFVFWSSLGFALFLLILMLAYILFFRLGVFKKIIDRIFGGIKEGILNIKDRILARLGRKSGGRKEKSEEKEEEEEELKELGGEKEKL